jgi:hypothetical protein
MLEKKAGNFLTSLEYRLTKKDPVPWSYLKVKAQKKMKENMLAYVTSVFCRLSKQFNKAMLYLKK